MHILFSKENNPLRVWMARLLIAIVLFWNLQAAFLFTFKPLLFIASFQLDGIPGKAAVAGYGILFFMWQVPYVFAFLHPVIFKISLWQALIMQSIGVLGETILLSTISSDYYLLRSSVLRFIVFDGVGIIILFGSLLLIKRINVQKDS